MTELMRRRRALMGKQANQQKNGFENGTYGFITVLNNNTFFETDTDFLSNPSIPILQPIQIHIGDIVGIKFLNGVPKSAVGRTRSFILKDAESNNIVAPLSSKKKIAVNTMYEIEANNDGTAVLLYPAQNGGKCTGNVEYVVELYVNGGQII